MFRFRVISMAMIIWSGIAIADEPFKEAPAPSFDEVLNGFKKDSAETIRMNVLRDLGETIGFRAGMAWEAQKTKQALEAHENELDRIYQFSPLVSSDRTLPPVIVEANDVASVSKEQFRTANKTFNIVKQEEFVSVPPTWRDYLFTGLLQPADIVYPGADAQPKNSDEKKAWEEAMKKGWTDGVEQAGNILDENFNRLARDYNGMLRYSALLKLGMISRTQISTQIKTISAESNKESLTIGEESRAIMKKAEFEVNPSKWRPVITKSPVGSNNNSYQYGGR